MSECVHVGNRISKFKKLLSYDIYRSSLTSKAFEGIHYSIWSCLQLVPICTSSLFSLSMYIIIPLVATAAAGAAAFFTYRTITSNRILDEQYKLLRDAAAKISGASKHPATILVMGFENHGRSSFINTVFRVLYKESGPLVMRAETGPRKKTTTAARVYRVTNKLLSYPKYLMNLIDTPTFSASDIALDEEKTRKILRGEIATNWKNRGVPAPECVVVVVRSDAAGVGGPACQMLPNVAKIIREEGLQFVVVLTHKKEARKAMDLQELIRQVALTVGTDFVKCIDNYVAEHRADEQIGVYCVGNNADTHIQTLSIVRQCFEYVKRRRQLNKSMSNNSMRKSKSLSALDDPPQPFYPSSASD